MRLAVFALALTLASAAAADDIEDAREAFRKGAFLAQDTQWAAALATFERSYALVPHPWTTYNMAVCQRALGQYVRARATFGRALLERSASAELPADTVRDIDRFQKEIDAVLATLDVTLDPADAAIAVDGAPLVADTSDPRTLVAGLGAGQPARPPTSRFQLLLDPGVHVIHVTHAGFDDAVLTETVRPAEHRALTIRVTELSASLKITSNQPNAAVKVDRVDVGTAPLVLTRPAGVYRVTVEKAGFDPFETDARLGPGQRSELSAPMREHHPSVVTRWWFWTVAGVVVAGVAATTWLATRPSPERPPVDTGGLGWAAKIP